MYSICFTLSLSFVKHSKIDKNKIKYRNHYMHLMHSLGILERCSQLDIKFDVGGSSMVLTDWRQLRLLEEVDFGWKASINIIRTPSTEHVWPMWICVCFCLLAMWILQRKLGLGYLFHFPELPWPSSKKRWKLSSLLGDDDARA